MFIVGKKDDIVYDMTPTTDMHVASLCQLAEGLRRRQKARPSCLGFVCRWNSRRS